MTALQTIARRNEVGDVRRLIVNADDFGRSGAINEAVRRAHREGILMCASLMVNEPAAAEAVEIAKANPGLGVGLHLSLVCGRAALAPSEIPLLASGEGRFGEDPVAAGLAYFFRKEARPQLEKEIVAQLEKFQQTGLAMDHLNGHLNLHLHPIVFAILMACRRRFPIPAMRLTRDPFWLNARLAGGRWLYRGSHAFIYWLLSGWARHRMAAGGVRHTPRVFGLLQNDAVDGAYLLKLLPALPSGDSEVYSHPSVTESKHELDALMSGRVREKIQEEGIRLIRYQDL